MPNKVAMTRRRRKLRKKAGGGGIITSALLIGAFLVFVSLYTATRATRVPENARIEVASRRTIEVAGTFPVFASARERVYVAPISGRVERIVPEGTVVRVGTPVAQVINDEAASRAEPEYAAAERELRSFGLSAMINLERARDQLMSLKVERKTLEATIADCERRGDMAGLRAARRSLQRVDEGIRELSDVIASQEKKARARAGELAGQLEQKREILELATSVITADRPGLVSYRLDGYEGVIDGPDVHLLSSRLEPVSREVACPADGQQVVAGSRIFKIIDTVEMLVALPGDSEFVKGLRGRVWVRFPEFDPSRWPARVTDGHRKPGEPVILSIDAFIPGVHARRFVKAEVITGVFEGVAVPEEAVFREGRDSYVYVIRSEDAVPVKVVIGPGDGKYVIVRRGIPEGTRVVCNPWILGGQHGRYPAER
ncbi:MAG TPA: efflux RND transporter periplasmic adaptor subunit [Firmicutes bacterium]|nr:efflux RND transporter periplasmic adaptor subunit [Bacillota bacterium]